MTQNVCRKNKFGYCYFGEKCHFRHVEEVCSEDNCNVFNCEKRHPKICKFMREYGMCKFTDFCKYDHKKCKDIIDNAKKLAEIQKQIEVIQKTNNSSIEKVTSDKLEAVEKKFESFMKTFEEKESVIKSLENKLKTIEEDFDKRIKDVEKALKHEQKKNENLQVEFQTLEIESEIIKCKYCEFSTSSAKGFKTHMKRKHTVKKKEVISYQCEVCEFKTISKISLKTHNKSHSYTIEKEKCKCNTCDFIGNNAWSLQIHNGKIHMENLECGLCDCKTKDFETLNLHLKTCEIYECNKCEFVANQLSGIRKHMRESNDCSLSTFHHIKIDRNNDEEAAFTEYEQSELFD